MRGTSILTAVVTAVLFLVAPVQAQEITPQEQPQQKTGVEVDDQELEAVARAYVSVQKLTADYRDRLNKAGDSENADAVQQEFADATNAAIEAEGLDVARYETVVQAAQADEELGNRLQATIDGLGGEQSSPGGSDSEGTDSEGSDSEGSDS